MNSGIGAQGRHLNFFLGAEFVYIFKCQRTIEKLEKLHFIIYVVITLFIVPLLSAALRSNAPIMFCYGLLSAALRSNAADYVLRRFIFIYLFIYLFFIHRSFSETTRPIHTKFSGIVYL